MSKLTIEILKNKAKILSNNYLPYILEVERVAPKSHDISLIANYGMNEKDLIYVGKIKDCNTYLDGIKIVLERGH